VSYMCQRQSSSPILPERGRRLPPCAATVYGCGVGKTLLMQAVFEPCGSHAEGCTQARAAAAADHDDITACGSRSDMPWS